MSRNLSIDLLKIVMALLVVALHTGFLKETSPTTSYFLSYGLFRMAVPIFLLINGYYFYPATNDALYSWCKRILWMYLFWMLVYSPFWLRGMELTVGGLATQFKGVLIGYHHLWYLPATLGAGVILYACRHFSSRALLGLASGLYLVGVTIQYSGNYHVFDFELPDKVFNTVWVYRNCIFFGFPFFTLGYLWRTSGIAEAVSQRQLILVVLITWPLLMLEVFINYRSLPKTETFDVLACLLLVCPPVFALVNRCSLRDTHDLAKTFALYSAAIYFVHPLFVSGFGIYMPLSTRMTLCVAVASTATAFFVIKLNQRLKFIL